MKYTAVIAALATVTLANTDDSGSLDDLSKMMDGLDLGDALGDLDDQLKDAMGDMMSQVEAMQKADTAAKAALSTEQQQLVAQYEQLQQAGNEA